MGSIERQKSTRNMIVVVMVSGAFIASLNQTVLSPALPSIMRELHINAAQGQWLTTAYMLVSGIMIPITAYLIDRFTTRQMYICSMLFFTAGTFVAGFAPSFGILLAGRILQAVASGILAPMVQTVLLLIFPKEKRGSAMGMVGIIMAFAPAVGPSLAGWVVDSWGWNMIFKAIVPLSILDIALAVFTLKNVSETKKTSLDMLSVVLSCFGFGGILYGCSSASSYGWVSLLTLAPLIVGIISLILFFRRQMKLKEPLLEVKVFKTPEFTYSTVIGMLIYASLISGTIITPIYVQNILHLNAMQSGLIMLPGSILMGVMSPVTGNLFDRFGPRKLSIIGLVLMTFTTICFLFFNENGTFMIVCGVYTLRLFGISLVMMPLNTWGLNALENRYISHGSAIYNTMRQVSGSIGTALLITIMVSMTNLTASQGFAASTLHGMHTAFGVATIISIVAVVMAFLFVRDKKLRFDDEF